MAEMFSSTYIKESQQSNKNYTNYQFLFNGHHSF